MGRTARGLAAVHISIHALREEGDGLFFGAVQFAAEFLSTPSARRATGVSVGYRIDTIISIHALREEGDRRHDEKPARSDSDFYPRPPRGGRPTWTIRTPPARLFLSTPSARRATLCGRYQVR